MYGAILQDGRQDLAETVNSPLRWSAPSYVNNNSCIFHVHHGKFSSTNNLTNFVHGLIKSIVFLVNTTNPEQTGRHFADDILLCIFLSENHNNFQIRLRFIPKGPFEHRLPSIQVICDKP